MTILLVVRSHDAEGEECGIATPIPDGWLDDPTKAESLCFSATQMFLNHVRKEGVQLPLGATILMHLEDRG